MERLGFQTTFPDHWCIFDLGHYCCFLCWLNRSTNWGGRVPPLRSSSTSCHQYSYRWIRWRWRSSSQRLSYMGRQGPWQGRIGLLGLGFHRQGCDGPRLRSQHQRSVNFDSETMFWSSGIGICPEQPSDMLVGRLLGLGQEVQKQRHAYDSRRFQQVDSRIPKNLKMPIIWKWLISRIYRQQTCLFWNKSRIYR